jgi:hypothetical protein
MPLPHNGGGIFLIVDRIEVMLPNLKRVSKSVCVYKKQRGLYNEWVEERYYLYISFLEK